MSTTLSRRFLIAKLYSSIYGFIKDKLKINIRGLGFVLRQVRQDHVLHVHGHKIFFSSQLAEAYARLLSGHWNEPETHFFIKALLAHLKASFIDVGANIGEILVDIAAHPSCITATGFEPNPAAAQVIAKNIELNSLINCSVIPKALGESKCKLGMSFRSHSPSASLLSSSVISQDLADVHVSTLDLELSLAPIVQSNLILLIDVEGYELNVIRGARNTIARSRPLIIFEYHRQTRNSFDLSDLRSELGDSYLIYRLRQDARLDHHVYDAWNCVAVPTRSHFEAIISSMIL